MMRSNPYYNGFFDEMDPSAIGMFAGIVGVFLVLVLGFMLLFYIFRSVALYRLAANRGMSAPGLAWIPIVGEFRIGAIADDIARINGSKTYFQFILLAGMLISRFPQLFNMPSALDGSYDFYQSYGLSISSFSGANSIFTLISIATFVLMIICLNKIYACYHPGSSTTWTVLSVIFPFLIPFFLFSIRNSAPADWNEPQQGYYPPNQNWQNQTYNPQQGYYNPQQPYQQQPNPQYNPAPQQQNQQNNPMQQQMYQPYQPPAAPNPPVPWENDNPSDGTPPSP